MFLIKKKYLEDDKLYINKENRYLYLQRYDQHKEFLFLVCENVFYEVPSRADKYNSNEENGSFQKMSNVI